MTAQIKHYQDKLNYEIDSADLADFFKGENFNEKLVVIDTRTADAFEEEHIPGAKSFPHRNMDEKSVMSLDKEALYITYCDGIGCNASTKGAIKMAKFGFKVKELMGGLDWWKRDGYSTEGKAGVKRNVDVHCAC